MCKQSEMTRSEIPDQQSPSVVLLRERNLYLILMLFMCLHQIIYILIEMDLCMFFLKADYYSEPAEKSFSCLQEMNKVSEEVDGKRVIVTGGCCLYPSAFKVPCLCSEFM